MKKPIYRLLPALSFALLGGWASANGLTQQNLQDHIFFPAGGTSLDATANEQVAALASVLETPDFAETCIALRGHSDVSGGAEVNLTISEERARAVAESFETLLGQPERIQFVSGVGFEEPLSTIPNTDTMQRRVAIYVGPCSRSN